MDTNETEEEEWLSDGKCSKFDACYKNEEMWQVRGYNKYVT
jgi:hypothetical protein